MLNNLKVLQQYLLTKEVLTFKQDGKSQFLEMVKRLCNKDLSNCRVCLAPNLAKTKNEWDYMLEFKPKTPLAEIYSLEFLTSFSKKY
jgi:hypothetical protein